MAAAAPARLPPRDAAAARPGTMGPSSLRLQGSRKLAGLLRAQTSRDASVRPSRGRLEPPIDHLGSRVARGDLTHLPEATALSHWHGLPYR